MAEAALRALPSVRRLTRERLRALVRLLDDARLADEVLARVSSPANADDRTALALIDEWRTRRHVALELLRRELPAGVDVEALVTGTTPVVEPIVAPPVVVEPRTPPATASGSSVRLVALRQAFDVFAGAVAATTKQVVACLGENGGDTRATRTTLPAERRARIEKSVDGLRKPRADFERAYEAAVRDARKPVPDARAHARLEAAARADIELACAPPDFTPELEAAKRCNPATEPLPPAVRAFIEGTGEYATYLDRRVYCWAGRGGAAEQPDTIAADEAVYVERRSLPGIGQPIGPDGFVLVVEEGRYFGVAIREPAEQRRRRMNENASAATRLVQAAAEAVAAAVAAAVDVLAAITAAVTSALGELARVAAELAARVWAWRTWLVTTLKWLADRGVYVLIGTVATHSMLLVVRALAALGTAVTSASTARALFALGVGAALVAYARADKSTPTRRALARTLLASALSALITGLTMVDARAEVASAWDARLFAAWEKPVNAAPNTTDAYEPFDVWAPYAIDVPPAASVRFEPLNTTLPTAAAIDAALDTAVGGGGEGVGGVALRDELATLLERVCPVSRELDWTPAKNMSSADVASLSAQLLALDVDALEPGLIARFAENLMRSYDVTELGKVVLLNGVLTVATGGTATLGSLLVSALASGAASASTRTALAYAFGGTSLPLATLDEQQLGRLAAVSDAATSASDAWSMRLYTLVGKSGQPDISEYPTAGTGWASASASLAANALVATSARTASAWADRTALAEATRLPGVATLLALPGRVLRARVGVP